MGGTLMLHLEMGVGERCQEWPSPRPFKFYVCRGLPATRVKATAPGRSSLPCRNSGGRLWRRNWRLLGRGKTGTLGCLGCGHPTRPVSWSPSWLPCALRSWVCALCATILCLHVWCWAGSSTSAVPASGHNFSSEPGLLAEHKAILKYYPWCSQWGFGHFYLGFSDLRSRSLTNQCQKIISCHGGRASACSRWWSCMSQTKLLPQLLDVWGFTILYVAEHLPPIFSLMELVNLHFTLLLASQLH